MGFVTWKCVNEQRVFNLFYNTEVGNGYVHMNHMFLDILERAGFAKCA
jgi:hypothetical protein